MRINRIKISGFKSFVDPTTLTLPGNLNGVVGPNGCGKSNIIDALIWVMGESSAKHLRGDSMSDMIFNGSNSRKPVGQATVEIVFDNTDGAIGGQYAGFGEISIKRTVSRDSVSNYFLNGARCRRKDITNVFLGTGIGARGYSVIEQGMISRVIEARPEELRSFLEEAAGISKYKERRRETENRMRHTDENIERLNDIREELQKQLNHLQRQARAAERYQVLKAEERKLEAKLLAVRWNTLSGEGEQARKIAEDRATELEAEVARLREIEANQTNFREAQSEATESFNKVQSEFYRHSNDITRVEQAIKHADEREQTLAQELQQSRARAEQAKQTIGELEHQIARIRQSIAALEPDSARSREREEAATTELQAAEGKLEAWQHEWDVFNREHTELAQREHAAQIRLEHLLADVADHETRRSVLDEEAGRIDTSELETRLNGLKATLEEHEQSRRRIFSERNAVRGNLTQSRDAIQTLTSALHELQSDLESQRGRLASLTALQEDAFGGDQEAIENWLRDAGLETAGRLAEFIDIEPGWELALEAVLRIPLGTLYGDNLLNGLELPTTSRPGGRVTLIARGEAAVTSLDNSDEALLMRHVRGPQELKSMLVGVYTAPDLQTAQQLRARIQPHEVVVMRDGTLLGDTWTQFRGREEREDNVLTRERRIAELDTTIEQHTADVANLRQQLDQAQSRYREEEEEEHRLTAELDQLVTQVSTDREGLSQVEAEYGRRQARAADVRAELDRIGQQSNENQESIAALRDEQRGAERKLREHGSNRDHLVERRSDIQNELDTERENWKSCREAAHALELKLQAERARAESLAATLMRDQEVQVQTTNRIDELEAAMSGLRTPREQMESELESTLKLKLETETKVTEARRQLGEFEETLRQAETQRTAIEQGVSAQQQRLEQARLDQRAIEVRLQELLSRFEQTEENLDQTVEALGVEEDQASVETEIKRLGDRISRLGPINLAAIDEFNQLSERKTYLDQQFSDLTEALETLKEAIRKIDRETRTRFKETYDKVNNGLQAMFPILFGGGHAYLELTGDDLLETGVTVMARPPGKRNSTIHLLSGGEKALTALAFVFSIFELNPAPFCLLDEVDAPLDDANVVRLTDMLTTMSQNIQFLFISHNKITMEIAEQLVGVTMQEAGVSRLVSVNMEEAVELAQSA